MLWLSRPEIKVCRGIDSSEQGTLSVTLISGAKIVENCRVHSLKVGDNGRVYGAETDQGFVQFKNFVNAAGLVSWLHGGGNGGLGSMIANSTVRRLPNRLLYSFSGRPVFR